MDLLDDIFLDTSAVKAQARPKFQPKSKTQPKKRPSVSVPSVAASVPKEQSVASVPVDSESHELVQSGRNLLTDARETVGLSIAKHSENSISKSSGDEHLNANRLLGSKSPQDIVGESTTAAVWPAGHVVLLMILPYLRWIKIQEALEKTLLVMLETFE